MLKTIIPAKVSDRLLVIFFLAALIIIITGILSYKGLENKVKFDAYKELSALSKIKVREVVNWQKERKNDANFIFKNEALKKLALKFILNTRDIDARSGIEEFVRILKENYEYSDILIIDTTGRKYSLFSNLEDRVSDRDNEYFKRAEESRKVLLTDLNRHNKPNDNKIHMSSFIPLFLTDNGKVFSVIEIKIDPSKVLFPSIQLDSDHNETSETFLVRREGNDVLFLNNLKYKDNTALNLRLPLTMLELPAAAAVLGKEGIFEGKDYRGIPVISDLQRVPDSPWFIVSKIDKKEAYSSLRDEAIVIAGFVIILVLLCGIIIYALWKQQQLNFIQSSLQSEFDKKILQDRIDYIVKNANDVVVLSDDYDKIVQANDKAVLVYGYTLEEFSLLTVADLRVTDKRKDLEADKKKVREHDGYIFETVHQKKDGTQLPVEVSSRLIKVNGKEYFQSIIRDISERKKYEEKLKSTISELNRSNKDLEQFAYVASHDLQEPLRMVHTYAQLLERRHSDMMDPKSKEYIKFLTEGANRMHQLIDALLIYSRINSGTENFKTTDLNEVLKTAMENLNLKIKESNARIIYSKLPVIKADQVQMVQLFQNLLSNAIKYKGKDIPEIRINAEKKSQEWLFSVQDNGIGLNSEYFDKIFLIFQRLHDRDQYEGTGIGLTICKKIVEHHGGRIWVESNAGKGSTFYFTIAIAHS